MKRRRIVLPLLVCGMLSGGCFVSSDTHNDLQKEADQLAWNLDREIERNHALQTYIDMVLKGNAQVQRPLIERKSLRTRAYQWNDESGDQVYDPYYLTPPVPAWMTIDIPKSLKVRHTGNSYVFVLENRLLFEAGSTEIIAKGKRVLREISRSLKGREDYIIRVEGHTDDNEVWDHPHWKDSWTLSVMRSVEVIRQLNEAGIPNERMIASGRGAYLPEGTPSRRSGREANRRVEIILSPIEGGQ